MEIKSHDTILPSLAILKVEYGKVAMHPFISIRRGTTARLLEHRQILLPLNHTFYTIMHIFRTVMSISQTPKV